MLHLIFCILSRCDILNVTTIRYLFYENTDHFRLLQFKKKTDIRNSTLYTAALILMYSYKYNNIQTEQRFPRKALAESIASVHSE